MRQGDRYVVNGQKVLISRVQHSDLMLLLARTTPLDEVKQQDRRPFGVPGRPARRRCRRASTLRPIRNMVNHETNEVFFDNFEIPAENLIGEEGKGFRYILDGMNAERILIAAECIGDGYWFVDKARNYARERVVFDRPIGQNQGVQFPIARAYANVRAADLMRYEAARLFDAGQPCGAEANMAKLLAADASWEAANACLQTHGGYRLRRGIRRRAQIPRDAPVPGGARIDEPDPVVPGRARAGHAALVLRAGVEAVRPLVIPASPRAHGRSASDLPQIRSAQRQPSNALARGRENRIADGRRDPRRAGLSHAAGRRGARNDVHFHLGHFVDPHHVVAVEVALLHAAALDGDAAF